MTGVPAVLRNGTPLVSVVVPCHGEGRYLDDCLGSLREQSYASLEIFVIDDAGDDDSFGVAVDLAANDDRVTVLRTGTNVGLGAVRNVVTARARGDLMLYLDGDDWIPSDAIAHRVSAFARLAAGDGRDLDRVAGIYGDWQHTTYAPDGAELHRPTRRMGTIDLQASRGGNVFIVSAPLVRREVMLETGGFTEGIVGGEDHLGWLRVLEAGYVFAPCGELVAFYRQKPQSMLRASTATLAAAAVAGREHVARLKEPPATPPTLIDSPLARHRSGEIVMRWGRPRVSRTRLAATGNDSVPLRPVPAPPTPTSPPNIELSPALEEVRSQADRFLEHGNEAPSTPAVTTVARRNGTVSFGIAEGPSITLTSGCEAGAIAAVLVARVAGEHGVESLLGVGRSLRATCHALVGFMDPTRWPSVRTNSAGIAGEVRISGAAGDVTVPLTALVGLGAALLGRGDGQVALHSGTPTTPGGSAMALDAATARACADRGDAVSVVSLATVARAAAVTASPDADAAVVAVLWGVETADRGSAPAGDPLTAVRSAIRDAAGVG